MASTGAEDESVVEPCRIIQLEETVINRIAAGEVVVRPANALKELMENSIDAGSSAIVINAKAGGLKMLRIEDDGHGIKLDDMPILCERFTTSKLRKYEDLTSISTFGFRGEALASISHVAHVTVSTMTANDSNAHVAEYTDGKLRGPPRPCAGTRGTTIVAEDMFYNNTTRRAALGKDSIEHSKLLEVVQRYAIHYPKVAFSCRKAGVAVAELQTRGGDETTSVDVIQIIYGQSLAKELFPFEASSEEARFKCHGFASGPNWTSRGSSLILFINNRLVECSALKRAIDAVYAPVLPRHQHPWVYISLELDPSTVDVNVHPTKSEVQFLHEVMIGEKVQEVLAARLRERAGSRTFEGKASLTGFGANGGNSTIFDAIPTRRKESVHRGIDKDISVETLVPLTNSVSDAMVEDSLSSGLVPLTNAKENRKQNTPLAKSTGPVPKPTRVRLDHQQMSLSSLWRKPSGSLQPSGTEDQSEAIVPMDDSEEQNIAFEEAQQLSSIHELKTEAAMKADEKLSKSLSQSIYVGPVSRDLVIVQCGAALCLVNLARVARTVAYQRLLRSFGKVPSFSLKTPLPLKELLRLGILDPESGYDPDLHSHVDVDGLAAKFASVLEEKAEMLHEYVSLTITNGMIVALPNAMGMTSEDGVTMDQLPLFLVTLCTDANWMDEKECFSSLCRLCASFCVETLLPSIEEASRVDVVPRTLDFAGAVNSAVESGEFADVAEAAAAASRKRARSIGPNALEQLRWLHEALRRDGACKFPRDMAQDGTVVELVTLDQLYRIFERC